VELVLKETDGDFILRVPLNYSVLDLKQQLSRNHPKTPQPEAQRIIFLGRQLRDEDTLTSIFSRCDLTSRQILHLMIRQRSDAYQYPPNPFPNTNPNVFPGPFPGFTGTPPGNWPGAQGYPGPYPPNGFPGYRPHGFPNPHMYPGENFNPHMPGEGPGVFFPPGAQVHRAGFALNIDFSLVIRLILVVYVLGQGRPNQIYFLGFIAVLYYLYQTFVPWFFAPDAPAPAATDPRQQNIPFYARDNVGWFGEVMRFVVPFCVSLLPGWTFPDNLPDRSVQPPQEPEAVVPPGEAVN